MSVNTDHLRVCWPIGQRHGDTDSKSIPFLRDGNPHRLRIELPAFSRGPIRLEPCESRCFIEIYSIILFAGGDGPACGSSILARWSPETRFKGVLPSNEILPLSSDSALRLVSLGDDPEL